MPGNLDIHPADIPAGRKLLNCLTSSPRLLCLPRSIRIRNSHNRTALTTDGWNLQPSRREELGPYCYGVEQPGGRLNMQGVAQE